MERADTISGFLFCVFSAPQPDALGAPPGAIYLRRRAEAEYLEQLLDELLESDDIGITTSDDEVIPPIALPALRSAIRSAIAQVEGQPETWPVLLGYRDETLRERIVMPASKAVMLGLLEAVLAEIGTAEGTGQYLYWCGGE
jgi:hypothetical protein